MEDMESIEYKSEKIMVLFVFRWVMITKLLTAVTKITKLTLMRIIVMKTQDLDPGVNFVKGEFWNERERKSFLVNNNPHLHVAHGIMQKDPSHS